MNLCLISLMAICLATGCAQRETTATTDLPGHATQSKVEPSDANAGVSIEHPVVITGVKGEDDGVAAEYAWLRQHRSGYQFVQQSLVKDHGRAYDKIDIKTSKGEESIYFDITSFYGK